MFQINERIAKYLLCAFFFFIILIVSFYFILLNNYEVLEKGVLLEYTRGTIYKIRFFDKFTLFIEPEHRLTRDVFNSFILTGISFVSISFSFIIALIIKNGNRKKVFYMFVVMSIGMFYLAFDEFFGIHETIGHNFQFLATLPKIKHPDDVIVLSYIIPVVLFIYYFFSELIASKKSIYIVGGVVIFTFLAAVNDVLSLSMILEEVSEIMASALLALAVLIMGGYHIDNMIMCGELKEKYIKLVNREC